MAIDSDAQDRSSQAALRPRRDAAELVASIHAQISPLELEKRAIAPTFLVQRGEWAASTSQQWMEHDPTNAVVQMPAGLIRRVEGNDDAVLGLHGNVRLCCTMDSQFERRYVQVVGGVLVSFESEPSTDEDRTTLARGALELRSVELIRPLKGEAQQAVCGWFGVEFITSDATWQIAFETELQYRRSLQMLRGLVEGTAVDPWLRAFLDSADPTTETSINIRPSTTAGGAGPMPTGNRDVAPFKTADRQLLCGYSTKTCTNERAIKKNGFLHRLCEEHRQRANMNQKRLAHRRRPARVIEPESEEKPETNVKSGPQQGDVFLAATTAYGVWSETTLGACRIKSSDVHVIQQLSRGRYGELWVGSLREKRVAIKRLAIGDQTKANALAFGSEIELMTKLEHPRLVAFIGVEWVKEWEAQVVTEFMPHGDLRTVLDAQQQKHKIVRLTWTDFKCQVAIDVMDALVYLHDCSPRVCMQTLKARNVLLETDPASEDGYGGRAKLSLYAVARSRPVLSASDADESSLRWLAPELAISESSWTDRAIIYSFGVFLSELDTAKLPYHDAVNPDGSAMSSFKILQLVSKGELRPSLSEDCPEAIAAVIRQCLAQDPHQRPSAAHLAFQLRHIRKNEL